MPYVFSPRDLVSIPDNMDEPVPHTRRQRSANAVKGQCERRDSAVQAM